MDFFSGGTYDASCPLDWFVRGLSFGAFEILRAALALNLLPKLKHGASVGYTLVCPRQKLKLKHEKLTRGGLPEPTHVAAVHELQGWVPSSRFRTTCSPLSCHPT